MEAKNQLKMNKARMSRGDQLVHIMFCITRLQCSRPANSESSSLASRIIKSIDRASGEGICRCTLVARCAVSWTSHKANDFVGGIKHETNVRWHFPPIISLLKLPDDLLRNDQLLLLLPQSPEKQ
jgi:hypothetical protein